MSTFLIILAVILWVGFSAFRKVKSVFADPSVAGDVSPKQDRPAVESLFEEKSSSMKASPYFSYETMGDCASNVAKHAETFAQPELVPQLGETANFDLRQAVIYQTILTNNYISDYQHQ